MLCPVLKVVDLVIGICSRLASLAKIWQASAWRRLRRVCVTEAGAGAAPGVG